MLGAFPDWHCAERVVGLDPGDTLIVFSDGVTEAGIDAGREFGEDRLSALIAARRHLTIGAVVDVIVNAARGYSPIQSDDVTVIGIRGV